MSALTNKRCVLAAVAAIVLSAIAVRAPFLPFESGDYTAFLSDWYDFLVRHGRWRGLGEEFASYPALYLYLLSLSTFLPLPKVYAVKLITLTAEAVVAAIFFWVLATPDLRVRTYNKDKRILLSFAAFCFLPTVVLNGAAWAQCDIMYTGCFLLSLGYLLRSRPAAAMVATGFAAALKPQSIFWAPFIAGLLITHQLKWRYLWATAAVYVVTGIPQSLAGRPILHTIGHWGRVGNYPGLAHGIANWYQWVSDSYYKTLYATGIVATLLLTACYLFWMSNAFKHREFTVHGDSSHRITLLISFSLIAVLFPPFLLPGMHERYYFAADVLSLLYAYARTNGWVVAVLIQFGSLLSYVPYLYQREPISLDTLALAPFCALIVLVFQTQRFLVKECPTMARSDISPSKHPKS